MLNELFEVFKNIRFIYLQVLAVVVLGCVRNDASVLELIEQESEAKSPPVDLIEQESEAKSPPVILSEPKTLTMVDFRYEYELFYESETDVLVTINNLPDWLLFDGNSILSGIPGYGDVGLFDDIGVTVLNQFGSVILTFKIDVVVDPSLKAHWPFDETSGIVATDVSGNANNGEVFGNPIWLNEGKQNGALRLDWDENTQDYVEIPNSSNLDNVHEGDYTLAAWVRPNSTPPGSFASHNNFAYAIIIKNGHHVGFWYDTNNHFVAAYHTLERSINAVSRDTFASGSFYHVAKTLDSQNNVLSLYVDGEIQTEVSFDPGSGVSEYSDSRWRIGIGYPHAEEYAWPAHADIDDVRIYSRVLSESEIQSLAGIY